LTITLIPLGFAQVNDNGQAKVEANVHAMSTIAFFVKNWQVSDERRNLLG
jgi:hypothetical protein